MPYFASSSDGLRYRKAQINANPGALSVSRQLELLHVPRSSYYYKPHEDLHKRYIDATAKGEIMQIYSETPFYGIRRITRELHRRGYHVNHKRVRRLRRETGLRTIYPCPHFNTSEPHLEHEKYPYLLKNLKIDHPNQVCATDITYTAVVGHRAFVIAIVDLYSRKNLAYNVVNTMDSFHCIETLQLAVSKYGVPEIFNSDPGSQFTSREFTDELKKLGIAISMDGRDRCRDNAKMERFWGALKYEDIKLNDYVSLPQLHRGVQSYVNFYNGRRLHSALGYLTPDSVYEGRCVPDKAS